MSALTQSDLNALLGQPAAVAYRVLLLAQPILQQWSVFRYSSPPTLQQRVPITAAEQAVIDQALEIRELTKIPFWHAVFGACLLRGYCTNSLLQGAFFHNGQGTRTDYDRAALAADMLDTVTGGEQANIGLGSKIIDSDGVAWHLNLLDFHCDIGAANTRIVHSICRELMPQGFLILDSGDSYHAAGIQPVSPEQRIQMLGKALLASPVVDVPYVAHQLQQDSSSIRISKGGKAKKYPIVVDAWCPDAN